jgi:hypothetical protein
MVAQCFKRAEFVDEQALRVWISPVRNPFHGARDFRISMVVFVKNGIGSTLELV